MREKKRNNRMKEKEKSNRMEKVRKTERNNNSINKLVTVVYNRSVDE